MKNLIFLMLALIVFSCKKEAETCDDGILNQDEEKIDCGGVCGLCPILYPHDGHYGENILNSSTTVFYLSPQYSLHAELPTGTSLKVIIKNNTPGSGLWFYSLGSAVNLYISMYNETTGIQTFESVNAGKIDLNMSFSGNGSAVVEIYENQSATASLTKNITW